MSMNTKNDSAYLIQYTDNAIKRGYSIIDEWTYRRYNSRKIVASAYGSVKSFKKAKTMSAFVEALAYIFAIDTRIKEKYNSIFRCLISYFSWRRETKALISLKNELNIPLGEMDIRDLISVEIEKLIEKLDDGWDEDGDDETHGGKRNARADEEAASEEKEAEATEEKTEAKDLADKEEAEEDSEEKEELPIEEQLEEVKEDTDLQNEADEPKQKESEITEASDREEPTEEKRDNLKEENNVSDAESDVKADKKEEVKAYNDAVDSPPLFTEDVPESSSQKISFIDEMIIDNMLKGDKSINGYQRIDESRRNEEASLPKDTPVNQNEKNKSTDKDAYLYDKTVLTDKAESKLSTSVESSAKQTEKVAETKAEQPKETIQNNVNVQTTEQEFAPISEMLQTDNHSFDFDNNIAEALNNNMSLDSKMAIIRMQEDRLREHISITLEELGMNDAPNVLRVSEPDEIVPPITVNKSK